VVVVGVGVVVLGWGLFGCVVGGVGVWLLWVCGVVGVVGGAVLAGAGDVL